MNQYIILMPAYKANLEVQIKQDQKQGLGLVDYEQTNTFPVWKFRGGQITIYEENQIYRESIDMPPNKQYLMKVNKYNKQYEIILTVQQPTFIVVKDIRSQQGPEYPLIVNSIIRLGRVEYKVIEERNKIMQTYQAPCQMKQNLDQQQTYQCKFCFIDGKQTKEEPFLTNICRCTGSNQAVHLECLRFWVDSNITKEETQFGLILKWSKQHECWVCKDPLPIRVQLDNQSIDLFTLDRPDLQYILLENTNKDNNNMFTELYLIHGLLSDNIKIGRGFQCDIKAQDITVSRHHATIKFDDGNFYIQDNKSKFGTLVQIDKKIEIDCQACSFQIGKLLINLIQSDQIQKGAPSTQHKLTQLPQINKQLDEEEPIMDDDSFQLENK